MYPSYSQPGMGGPGYPMMPPQPNLMMGMPQQGNNEGLNNVFNAQADAMKTMNRSIKTPYQERDDSNEGDNDDSDCDEEKNIKDSLKNSELLTRINIEPNPFKYIFGASEENWHKYYDFTFNQDKIYKDYVVLNNANDKNNTKPQAVNDMEILRRVVKQGPILMAKTWLTRCILVFIIILIIMTILFVNDIAQSYVNKITFIIVGVLSFIIPLACLYDWKYNSKGRGINRWTTIKSDVRALASGVITVEDIHNRIAEKFKYLHPFQVPIIHRNGSAPPAQQSGSGLVQGVANIVQLFNK